MNPRKALLFAIPSGMFFPSACGALRERPCFTPPRNAPRDFLEDATATETCCFFFSFPLFAPISIRAVLNIDPGRFIFTAFVSLFRIFLTAAFLYLSKPSASHIPSMSTLPSWTSKFTLVRGKRFYIGSSLSYPAQASARAPESLGQPRPGSPSKGSHRSLPKSRV